MEMSRTADVLRLMAQELFFGWFGTYRNKAISAKGIEAKVLIAPMKKTQLR
jgi:hypothetical protein